MKAPKALRRAADTQLGSAIMAQLIPKAGRGALRSEAAHRIGGQVQAMAAGALQSIASAFQPAASPAPFVGRTSGQVSDHANDAAKAPAPQPEGNFDYGADRDGQPAH